MLQNTSKTLGFKKNMVYKTPPGGGGKPYLAHGLLIVCIVFASKYLIAHTCIWLGIFVMVLSF